MIKYSFERKSGRTCVHLQDAHNLGSNKSTQGGGVAPPWVDAVINQEHYQDSPQRFESRVWCGLTMGNFSESSLFDSVISQS